MSTEKKTMVIFLASILVVLAGALGAVTLIAHRSTRVPGGTALQVIAGENFWGSIVAQIGGSHTSVTTMVSDPNADPHEFSSTAASARAFAKANYVILNGAGYDSWGDHLLSASANPQRRVLHIADIVGKKEGDNPHLWYGPSYVNQAMHRITSDLITLDPANTAYYQQNAAKLEEQLSMYQSHVQAIKQTYAGTKVAATEDVFQYLADAMGLDLVSPPAFTQAVAEGNDPPAASVVQFQQQITDREVTMLVYNTQTVTPLTENMKQLAAAHHIPLVGVSETISPLGQSFQDWMNSEVIRIQDALQSHV